MIAKRLTLALTFILASTLASALAVAGFSAAAAQGAKPVITTPTPQPTPTLSPAEARRVWLLTPEAERSGNFIFLPLITVADPAEAALHTDPASFTYEVRAGDTLWSLALDFGRDLEAMSCVTTPTGRDAETLTPGQTITVPALDDVCYTVTPGDTLAGIAAKYGITVEAIVAVPWNGFTRPPYRVTARQRVLLPGVNPDAEPRPDPRRVSRQADVWAGTAYEAWPYGDGKFIWPVVGPISQGAHAGHIALDIAVPSGTPIRAADRGRVLMAGWNPTGYGFRVVIDHGTDYVTLYAHLSDIYVEAGQVVSKGQVIGASGANGNITGPHLHFEVRDYGQLIDPRRVLPK